MGPGIKGGVGVAITITPNIHSQNVCSLALYLWALLVQRSDFLMENHFYQETVNQPGGAPSPAELVGGGGVDYTGRT